MKTVKRFCLLFITLLLCALFALAMFFINQNVYLVPQAQGQISYKFWQAKEDGTGEVAERTLIVGKDFTAVRINDLTDFGALTKVNYVPDEFITPSQPIESQIVDLTKEFKFAKKGTLFFVVLNLDSTSENFDSQSDALEKYKRGDYWCFSISLPKIFSASNVYLDSQLKKTHGEIAGYNFIKFNTSYDKVSQTHLSKTEKTGLDLSFYTRREAISAKGSYSMVTIHYESENAFYSGINDCPLIGTETNLNDAEQKSNAFLLSAVILSAMAFAVLVVLSSIKRSFSFISELAIITASLLLFLAQYLLYTSTAFPILFQALSIISVFLLLAGGGYSILSKLKIKWLTYSFLALSGVGALLSIIVTILPLTVAVIINAVVHAIGTAIAIIVFALLIFYISKSCASALQIICNALITSIVLISGITGKLLVIGYTPFWLYIVLIAITFLLVFKIFSDTERSNSYLTQNLNLEVERQIKEVKSVISERDKLLQFVSHDMKKPLNSASILLQELSSREKDSEQVKMINVIKQNTDKVINNLSEIASFAKYNYIAESSQKINLTELCKEIYKYSVNDCSAVGIVLKNNATKNYQVFAKRQGLENVVTNIIFNAIEHAECSQIELSLESYKNTALLKVTDNGKGIAPDIDVFRPYVSEQISNGDGLGLYICKNIIENMNGQLYYVREQGKTSFVISLLKA